VSARWSLAKVPGEIRKTVLRGRASLRDTLGLSNGNGAAGHSAPGIDAKELARLPLAKVCFQPKDPELGRLLEDQPGYNLLFHELIFADLRKTAPIFDDEEYQERRDMLYACKDIHYVRLSDGTEMVVFGGDGIRFIPGKYWVPPGSPPCRKGKRGGERPKTSITKRRAGTVRVRVISIDSVSNNDATSVEVNISDEPVGIWLGDRRFRRRRDLSYEEVRTLIAGDVLNPRYELTRAYDPSLPFLKRDEQGHNVLTDFRDISIPLFWPNWDDSRLEHLAMLQAWTERSYEAFVFFLEGRRVDSLDEFISSEKMSLERIPKEKGRSGKASSKDRKGQCYHGDYHSLAIRGIYFLFEVRRGDKTFFLVDSPFYGIALRAYWNRQDAIDDIDGGESRERVIGKRIWVKQNHDPNGKWIVELEQNIVEHVECVTV
jgi:hypothetical protein